MGKRKILVTGAEGFIGSHVVEALLAKGFAVRAFVLYNSFDSRGWLDSVEHKDLQVMFGDIRDPERVKDAVLGCHAVLHLASLIAVPYSYDAPRSFLMTNAIGALNVLQACREHGIHRIVHTSTSEVYGSAQYTPIDESHPLQAQSPYAASKIAADQVALSFHRSYGLPVVVLRPFNTYGPRQSARAVIPAVILQLIQGKEQIRLGALDPRRDFNYVTDIAEGFIRALETPDIEGEVINLGTGFDVSIQMMVDMVRDILGSKTEILTDAQRIRPAKSEVNRLCAANEKAKALLSWKPEFSGKDGLYNGLQKTCEWFKESGNRDRYRTERYAL